MALFKLNEYYSYYQEVFNCNDIINVFVYDQNNDKFSPVTRIKFWHLALLERKSKVIVDSCKY